MALQDVKMAIALQDIVSFGIEGWQAVLQMSKCGCRCSVPD